MILCVLGKVTSALHRKLNSVPYVTSPFFCKCTLAFRPHFLRMPSLGNLQYSIIEVDDMNEREEDEGKSIRMDWAVDLWYCTGRRNARYFAALYPKYPSFIELRSNFSTYL